MITLETKIKGKLVGHLTIHNTRVKTNNKDIYEVEYYRPNTKPYTIKFTLEHQKEGGAEALILAAYKKIDKELKKHTT
jgi:hypothetical protein